MPKQPLMLDFNPTKIVAVGMSGCGKTLWANRFIRQSGYGAYFIYDHDGQFAQRNRVRPTMTTDGILWVLKTSRFVVFNPSEMFSDLTRGFEWFCHYAYKMSEQLPGSKLIYCDELQDIIGVNRIPEAVRKVLVSGRNRGLDFIGCSLQYNMIHNAIRGQATITVAFKTEEKRALEALTERGFSASRVSALKPGQFILRNARAGTEEVGKIF